MAKIDKKATAKSNFTILQELPKWNIFVSK